MVSKHSNYKQSLIFMHLSVLLWGVTGVLGRAIELSEGVLVSYRLFITVFTLGLHAFVFLKLKLPHFSELKRMMAVGILITIHWLCFYGGIKYANVSITLSMLASQALFTIVFERIFLKKKFQLSEFLLGFIAMIGIWIIFYGESAYGIGIVLAILAALFGSLFNVFNKSIVEKHDPILVSLVEILAGLVFLLLTMPMYVYVFQIEKLIPSSSDWLLLFFLAFVCTHVTLILSLKALRYLDAFTLNLSINLEPVYGIALAFFIYKEHQFLSTQFFVGGFLILLSVVAHGYMKSRAKS